MERRRSFQLKKHKRQQHAQPDDHITNLPDEILSDIISHLTLVEAARTSLLARRWNKLWYHLHGALEFDDTYKIISLPENTSLQDRKEAVHACLSSNRQVLLQLVPSPFLGAFTVRCSNMDEVCKAHLDFCVQFAMANRIKSFELDTSPINYLGTNTNYNFPLEFYAWIKQPCGLNSLSSLTSLSFNRVNVSDELIHHLLVYCPLLESLRVRASQELFNPKFIGETLKLKYLEILGFHLESIEICAPNLLTFSTQCWKVKLVIKNAPKLVELSIPVKILVDRLESVSSVLPQLERLIWDFSVGNKEFEIPRMTQFVEQNKLQHLTWTLADYFDRYTIALNSLLEASPFLHKFTLAILLNTKPIQKMVSTVIRPKHPHQCLKVLQINGFTGADAEVKLVRYFIANTTSIEEIILDTISPFFRGTPWPVKPNRSRRIKSSVLKLKNYLPRRVSMVIIEQ